MGASALARACLYPFFSTAGAQRCFKDTFMPRQQFCKRALCSLGAPKHCKTNGFSSFFTTHQHAPSRPKLLQDAPKTPARRPPDRPETSTRCSKTLPRRLQDAPLTVQRRPQDAPRRCQDAQRRFKDASKTPQDAPKTPPRRPKTTPRRPKTPPRRPKTLTRRPKKPPRRTQDASKTLTL